MSNHRGHQPIPPARHSFNTLAIHAGQAPDPLTGAVIPPIYQTSTFVQDGINVLRNGHEYSRGSNPTRGGFETQLTALEAGHAGFAFASGIAAEDALLRAVLEPGDHIVLGADGYGGTNRLINRLHGKWGITNTPVDITDLAAVAAAVQPGKTALLWVETPSNPLLGIADVAGWARIARDAGALLVVDNTFATPFLQRPITLGADVVVHSTTKYIGGHSDVLGGAVIVARADLPRPVAGRGRGVPAVRRGSRGRPAGLFPGRPRAQDPGAAHGAPLLERRPHRRMADHPRGGFHGAVPGARIPPGARAGQDPVPRLRRHRLAAIRRRRGRRPRLRRIDRAVCALGVPGRGRIAGLLLLGNDPRLGDRHPAGGARRTWCGSASASSRSRT